MKQVLLLIGSWVLLAGIALAQDYPRIAPKEVIPIAPAQSAPSIPVPKAQANSEVLLPKLKGLVFVAKPGDVVKSGVHNKGIAVKDVPVPNLSDFTAMTGKYLGTKLTRGDLNHLITDIILYYRNHDRPMVDVIAPEQDIATGTVQLIVLEGHVAKVTVAGNRWFSNEEIRDGVTFQHGDANPLQAVHDGEEALEYLEGRGRFYDRSKHPFPLVVFLDLNMPKKSGLEVLEYVRQQPSLKKLTINILSSSTRPADINRAAHLLISA